MQALIIGTPNPLSTLAVVHDPSGFIIVCVLILVALAVWALWKTILRAPPFVDHGLIALDREVADCRRAVAIATTRRDLNKAERALATTIRNREAYLDDQTADA